MYWNDFLPFHFECFALRVLTGDGDAKSTTVDFSSGWGWGQCLTIRGVGDALNANL